MPNLFYLLYYRQLEDTRREVNNNSLSIHFTHMKCRAMFYKNLAIKDII